MSQANPGLPNISRALGSLWRVDHTAQSIGLKSLPSMMIKEMTSWKCDELPDTPKDNTMQYCPTMHAPCD